MLCILYSLSRAKHWLFLDHFLYPFPPPHIFPFFKGLLLNVNPVVLVSAETNKPTVSCVVLS